MTGTILWSSQEAAQATGGALIGPAWAATGVAIDSRSLRDGDLFVAIQGPIHDGHEFVEDAFRNGAVAAIVRADFETSRTVPLLRVNDPLAALRGLGQAARARTSAKIVAVTGSVGKTGTKEALRAALARDRATHASMASFNNHWGVPLSLARMPRDTAYGVFEIGMNHAGEITPLSQLVRPHTAIVTTVEPVHLEFFDSVAGIADAKAEIFLGLEPGGTAVINRDNAYYARLAAAARDAGAASVVGFGEAGAADARLIKAAMKDTCSCISADICGQPMTYKIGAPGRHWVMNSLAVLAAVASIGGDLGLAGLALADLAPPEGRGQRTEVALRDGGFLVIDESYNANPASMGAAIELLGSTPVSRGGRRIAVLGDMLELGDDSPSFHAALATAIAAAGVDIVFCCGAHMKALADALPPATLGAWFEDSDSLVADVLSAVRPGDALMVKGSLGSRMAPIVHALKSLDRSPRRANGA